MGLENSPVGGGFFVVDIMLDSFFFLDILIRCNTAFLDEVTELFILDRRRIIREYAKFWLWVDLLSCVPFDTIASGPSGVTGAYATLRLVRILRLSRLVKIVRMLKLKRMKKIFENMNVSPSLIALGSLMFNLTFLAHFIACFWFYMSTEDVTGVTPPDTFADANGDWTQLDDQRMVTWVTVGNLQYATELDQYVAAIYWVITTMLSVGYGKYPEPTTQKEFFVFLQCLWAALCLVRL